ncbi:MAG: thiol reductant ABC exporter subunit CydC [Acetobacteraceae bacterium]|nr:thiol reductant ABC exporter subunit CydC [Acetobacteraceae bacterium]
MRDLAHLLALCRPQARWMAAGIALNVVVILANVGLLALSGWFIASMALAGLGALPFEYFAPAAAIRGLAILRTVSRYLERLVTHEATFRLLATLRVWFYGRIEPLAPAGLQLYRGGDLLSRLRSDIDSLDTFFLRIVAPATAALVTSAILVGFLSTMSGEVAWIEAGGLLAGGVALPLLAQRAGRRPGTAVVRLRAELRVVVAETVQGLGELLITRAARQHSASVQRLGTTLLCEQRRRAWLDSGGTALSGLVAQLCLWGAIVVLIPRVRAGTLPGPDLALVSLFVLASFEAVAPLPAAFLALGETRAAARRILALVDTAPAVGSPSRPAAAPRSFGICFRGVRMRYADNTPWALDGLDAAIAPGEALGIVGPSGSGKTSIINVLLRFWDYQGEITIGDVPLRALDAETARGLFGVVSQQTHLFNTSVRGNLTLARPNATEAELRSALRAAAFEPDLARLPEGLDTIVGENGTRLSGGQARRLSIARGLLKDAPILLLDEPTEGLDAASEAKVLGALRVLMQGRTTLLISHRPAALQIVDRVISLERGRIVEG